MKYRTLISLALFLVADAGSAQCTRYISVANATGQDMSGLVVVFAGIHPSVSADVEVEPDADPVCPPPTVGGDLLATLGIGWGIDCVDPGSTVTFQGFSSQEINPIYSGEWSNEAGQQFPIAAESFVVSADCNGNCIADELDIAAGTSADADQNGVPDECEAVTAIPALTSRGVGILVLTLLGTGMTALRWRRRATPEPQTIDR